MNKLIPFDTIYLQSLEIHAELLIDPQNPNHLLLSFKIQDDAGEIDLAAQPLQLDGDQTQKKDELWKSTCFEMFLNPVGQKQYYEFNFNPLGHWNCYHFAGYRFPQPPNPSVDFEILKFHFSNENLQVWIRNKSAFQAFHVGLTAVIKNKKDQTTYFSLKHENSKPDFHLASTFTLQRG